MLYTLSHTVSMTGILYEKSRLHPESLMKGSRHKFKLGHVDKLRMFRTRVYWGVRLEPVDPETSTLPCARLNREIPRVRARQRKQTERIAVYHRQSMISSTLGSNSGSEHPVMRAKHFEAVFTPVSSKIHNFHDHFIITFIITFVIISSLITSSVGRILFLELGLGM